jgi:hypothetical protein
VLLDDCLVAVYKKLLVVGGLGFYVYKKSKFSVVCWLAGCYACKVVCWLLDDCMGTGYRKLLAVG